MTEQSETFNRDPLPTRRPHRYAVALGAALFATAAALATGCRSSEGERAAPLQESGSASAPSRAAEFPNAYGAERAEPSGEAPPSGGGDFSRERACREHRRALHSVV